MRTLISVVGLLLALAIVGLLAKKQFAAVQAPPAAAPAAATGVPAMPAGPPQQQVQQVQQAIDAAVQSRPLPDEAK